MNRLTPLIREFLLKTFDIREGEYQRVLLMQLNIFLIILTLLIIKPVVNAQFLSVIGIEQLPFAFLLVAISAMGVSTFYARVLNTRSLRRVTSGTLMVSILALIGIGLLLNFNIAEKLVLYIFYIGVAIFGVLTTSQFWIMANLAFDAREAKRLFSFIGAGPIAGGVAGGYLTSILVSFVEGPDLLFVAAALLAICIPLNNIIWRKHIKPLSTFQQKKRLSGFADHPVWLIRKSKHLTYLALIIGIGVIVSKLVEFQYSSVASASIEDPDELTAFFGFWFSTFNVVSLLVQLFLTKRIVGTFGVGSSLYVLPGGVMVGSLTLLFAPVLWAGIFTKLWEVSVKQSVNKAATELLALPIPASIKSQTKTFIDVFVDMAATGIAGVLLIFIISGLDLSVQAVSLLTIVMLAIWFWIALKVRHEYINSFKSKLSQADKQASKKAPDFQNTSVLSGLKKALDSGTDKQIIYVLEKVREISDKRMFGDVARFLSHENAQVRIKALECIYFLEKTLSPVVIERLLHDPDQDVRYLAFEQLFRQTTDNRIDIINQYLLHEDPMISGAALVGLAVEARNNPELKKHLRIDQRVSEKLKYAELSEDEDERLLYKKMVLRAIGHARLKNHYNIIAGFMKDNDPQIVKEAILAAGHTMHQPFIEPISSFLITKDTRPYAQKALLLYGVGIAHELQLLAKNPEINLAVIHQIPGVMERLDDQVAVRTLLHFLNTRDVNLRLEALRALNTIQHNFPHLKIKKEDIVNHIIDEATLYKEILGVLYLQNQMLPVEEPPEVHEAREKLIELLERRLDGTLERIFRLLGLRYPPEDVIPVYEGIRSVNPDVRMNSVEFLDNVLEPTLKKTLVPIVETASFESLSVEAIHNLKVKVPDEARCLALLLEGRDPKLKMAVFKLITLLKKKEYIALVEPFTRSPYQKIRERAIEVVRDLSA